MTIENNKESSFPFYHSPVSTGIPSGGTTDAFFHDLEDVLIKHLTDDWEWKFDGNHPLLIFSEKLSQMWETEMGEWDGDNA